MTPKAMITKHMRMSFTAKPWPLSTDWDQYIQSTISQQQPSSVFIKGLHLLVSEITYFQRYAHLKQTQKRIESKTETDFSTDMTQPCPPVIKAENILFPILPFCLEDSNLPLAHDFLSRGSLAKTFMVDNKCTITTTAFVIPYDLLVSLTLLLSLSCQDR